MRKVKNNVFVTEIPATYKLHEGDENVCTDTKLIVQRAFQILNPVISTNNYTVEKVFQPVQGRTRHSAKVVFKDFESKMSIIKNGKKFKDLDENDTFRAIFVKFDDPPLTSMENKRLSDKLKRVT